MATTANRAWPYAGPNDGPDVPYWLQRIAEKGEAEAQAAEDALNAHKLRKHAQFTSAAVDAAPAAGTYFGQLTVDAANTFNNDFATTRGATGYGLNITKAGVYAIAAQYLPAGDPGAVAVAIHLNAAGTAIAATSKPSTYGNWEMTVNHAGVYIAAGGTLEFIAASATGALFGSRIYLTRLSD